MCVFVVIYVFIGIYIEVYIYISIFVNVYIYVCIIKIARSALECSPHRMVVTKENQRSTLSNGDQGNRQLPSRGRVRRSSRRDPGAAITEQLKNPRYREHFFFSHLSVPRRPQNRQCTAEQPEHLTFFTMTALGWRCRITLKEKMESF